MDIFAIGLNPLFQFKRFGTHLARIPRWPLLSELYKFQDGRLIIVIDYSNIFGLLVLGSDVMMIKFVDKNQSSVCSRLRFGYLNTLATFPKWPP